MSAESRTPSTPMCEHDFPQDKCIQLKSGNAQELTVRLMAALQRHGYGGGLCHCKLCVDLPVPEELVP